MTPNTITQLTDGVLIAALVIAVVTDVRTQKIYNWLTFPVFAIGFILNGVNPHFANPGEGLLFALSGVVVACLSLLLFILVGGMGAGDVKLLWAVGALMGPHFTLWTLLCTAIAGGVLGLGYALKRGEFKHTVRNALIGGHVLAATQSSESVKGLASMSKVGKMPYAPAIALGVAIAAILLSNGFVD